MLCGMLILCTGMKDAHAALPTLSGLSDTLENLQTRYSETTNTLNETRARLEEATNTLSRIIAALNSYQGFRKALHGNFKSFFETNFVEKTIQRIDVYDDGYRHVERGTVGRYYTPEEMAERIAKRKPKKTLDERIADIQADISRLEDKKNNAMSEEDMAKAIISIYNKRRSLERLEASRTNIVTVTVTP